MNDGIPVSPPGRAPLEWASDDDLIAEICRRSINLLVVRVPLNNPSGFNWHTGGSMVWMLGAMQAIRESMLRDVNDTFSRPPPSHPTDLSEGGGA